MINAEIILLALNAVMILAALLFVYGLFQLFLAIKYPPTVNASRRIGAFSKARRNASIHARNVSTLQLSEFQAFRLAMLVRNSEVELKEEVLLQRLHGGPLPKVAPTQVAANVMRSASMRIEGFGNTTFAEFNARKSAPFLRDRGPSINWAVR